MDTELISSNRISLAATGLILIYCLRKYWDSKSVAPLPPGPPGLPLIGSRKFLIVNKYESMCELLDKRGSKYIDRAQGVMVAILMRANYTTPRLQANTMWRKHRKLLRQALSLDTIKRSYSDLFVTKSSEYLQAVLQNPDNFLQSLKRVLGETIAELTYGALKHEDGTDYVTKHEENFEYLKRAAFGYLVDLIPIQDLEKREAETGADMREDVQATEVIIKNFLLAMVLYPNVQARARSEVDLIYGKGHPPDYDAQDRMPYIHSVLLECMRWNPPVPSGVPHLLREDDIYEGYFIPKGTAVIANQWTICRDPAIYKDPSTFNPDRFIENPDILDPRELIFGFGRRTCPGNYLAFQLAWIFIVSVLWGFELERPDGEPALDEDLERFDLGAVRFVTFCPGRTRSAAESSLQLSLPF
ncbi:hypothetical protein FRB90_003853 [Tulasnella sp. 427]|nr:hypothetical protein FRB90_003853 [Tulasnella sp. 427]